MVERYFLRLGEGSGLWEWAVGCRHQVLLELSALEVEGPPIGVISEC